MGVTKSGSGTWDAGTRDTKAFGLGDVERRDSRT